MILWFGFGLLPKVLGHPDRINPERFARMARFLFDSFVLEDPAGAPLEWPGDVSDWNDQSWISW